MNKNDFIKNCPPFESKIDLDIELSSPFEQVKKIGLGGVFGYIFCREIALEAKIFNLEGINIGEDQILLAQMYKIFPAISVIKNYFYVYDNTSSSLMRSKWSFEKFLEDRVYTYLAMEIFSGDEVFFREIASQRLFYIINKQIGKCFKDLEKPFSNFLSCIYIYDFIKFSKYFDKNTLVPKF